jgi:hypothetical protein
MDNFESPVETPETQPKMENQPIPRPGSVTLLSLGVLIIAVINLTRLVLSIKYWSFLSSWPGVPPLYMALTGLIWTLAGFPLLWGLWRAKPWAPRLMRAVMLTYALYYWMDHIFLVGHPVSGADGAKRALLPVNWPFAAGVTVVLLAFTAWTLGRPKVKAYFGLAESEPDESESKGEDIG